MLRTPTIGLTTTTFELWIDREISIDIPAPIRISSIDGEGHITGIIDPPSIIDGQTHAIAQIDGSEQQIIDAIGDDQRAIAMIGDIQFPANIAIIGKNIAGTNPIITMKETSGAVAHKAAAQFIG